MLLYTSEKKTNIMNLKRDEPWVNLTDSFWDYRLTLRKCHGLVYFTSFVYLLANITKNKENDFSAFKRYVVLINLKQKIISPN